MLNYSLVGGSFQVILDVFHRGGLVILFEYADQIGAAAETYHHIYRRYRDTLVQHKFDCMFQPDLLNTFADGLPCQ